MYESPIEIIKGAFTTECENGIMTAVQKYGVNVDKEELIKALNYDRRQYDKGFEDGRKSALIINLNDRIKVKLTDYGKEVYRHRFDVEFARTKLKVFKPENPKIDDEGYTSFQLWDFISIFGNYIGMGLPVVICPLDIICCGE